MIDHVGLRVSDYAASRAFYEAALRPLAYEPVMEMERACGFGIGGKPDFWIIEGTPPAAPVHVAFASPDRQTVDAFHAAALAAGGRDNGAPGLRPHYHEHYCWSSTVDGHAGAVSARDVACFRAWLIAERHERLVSHR